MTTNNKGKAGIINLLSLFIEPYRFIKKEIDQGRRRRLLFSILASLILIILITVPDETLNPNHPTPVFLAIIRIYAAITIFVSFTIIIVLSDRHLLRNYLILMGLIVLAFTFKRFRFPFSNVLIISSLCTLGLGNYILCIKYLRQIKENKYLMIMGSIGAFIIGSFSLSITFKYMHWPGAGIFAAVSLVPMLLLTFIILATLPNSGFINWSKKHKEILTKRLLIPWVLLLTFTALRMLLPADISNKIFFKDRDSVSPFFMNDFSIELREGLEEEPSK